MRRLLGIPHILWLFALLQVAIYLDGSLAGPHFAPPDFAKLVSLGAAYSPQISLGHWWLPFTALFVPLRLLHLIFGCLTLLLAGKAAEELQELEVAAAFFAGGLSAAMTSIYLAPYSLYGGDQGAVLAIYSLALTLRLVRRESHVIRSQQLIYAGIPALILLPMIENSAVGPLDYVLLVPPLVIGAALGLCLSLNGWSKAFYLVTTVAIAAALAGTILMPARPDLLRTLTTLQELLSQYQSALIKYRKRPAPKSQDEFLAQKKFIADQLLQPLLRARSELIKLESSAIRKQAVQELVVVQTLMAESKWTLLGLDESEKLKALEARFKTGRTSAEQASYEIATVLLPGLYKAKAEIAELLNLPEFDEAVRKGALMTVNNYSANVRKNLEQRMAILEGVALAMKLRADSLQYYKILGPKFAGAESALKFMSDDFKRHLEGANSRQAQMAAYFVDLDLGTRLGLGKTLSVYNLRFGLLHMHAIELVLKERFAGLSTQLKNRTKRSPVANVGSIGYVETAIKSLLIANEARQPASVNSGFLAKFQALRDRRLRVINSISDALKTGDRGETLRGALHEWESINESPLEKELFEVVSQMRSSLASKPTTE